MKHADRKRKRVGETVPRLIYFVSKVYSMDIGIVRMNGGASHEGDLSGPETSCTGQNV